MNCVRWSLSKFLAMALLLFSIGLAQTHPRLLFGPEDIAELRAKKSQEPFASMMALIENDAQNATDWVSDYNDDYRAVNSAFMYILTGEKAWADKARSHVEPVIDGSQWATSVKGLRLYMHGKSVALAYDMCYSAWDEAFRKKVSTKLKEMADYINDNGGREQNTDPASNWQGNRFASGGLCYLATDDSYDANKLINCYEKIVRYSKENMGDSPKSRGWNIEGLGYTTYPFGQFIGAFGIAMARAEPQRDIRLEMESVKWTPWTVYAAGVPIQTGLGEGTPYAKGYGAHPDFGDDNPYLRAEGTYGLAFYYCHDELIPGLKYWYDRMEGLLAPEAHFDHIRHGTIYSYLYYPDDLEGKDPMSIRKWRDGFMDVGGNGYFTYRNQYQDEHDMVAQIYLKLRGNKGHNGPDALSFRLLGQDTPFGVGGGRYGPEINGQDAYVRSMNTLYPMDPEAAGLSINGNSGSIVGTPHLFANGSGHVISRIGKNNVGVDNQKRWFVADYSNGADISGVYVIGDISDNGKYWQMCALASQDISVDESSKTFTIAGANGSSLKGHVLYQSGALSMQTGTRIRGSHFTYKQVRYTENNFVHFQSDNGDFVVVLTVAKSGQSHPSVSMSGDGVEDAVVTVGNKTYTLQQTDVLYNGKAPNKAPVAIASLSADWGPAPFSTNFDASASSDPESDPLSYTWNFGDGNEKTGETVQHTFSEDGIYKVTLVASDGQGNAADATLTVYVSDSPPSRPVIIQDTDAAIIYEGSWSKQNDPEWYSGSTIHIAGGSGASFTYDFTGSKITLYSYSKLQDEQQYDIYLDDMSTPIVKDYSPPRTTQKELKIWTSGEIEDTDHTLKIVAQNKYANIDYLELVTSQTGVTQLAPGAPGTSVQKTSAAFSALPMRSGINVRFLLAKSANTELAVFDLRGKKEIIISKGFMSAGQHALLINSEKLGGSGVYIFQLRTESGPQLHVQQRRVMLLR